MTESAGLPGFLEIAIVYMILTVALPCVLVGRLHDLEVSRAILAWAFGAW